MQSYLEGSPADTDNLWFLRGQLEASLFRGGCGSVWGHIWKQSRRGGVKLASGDVAGRGAQLTQEEASLTGLQNSTRSPGVQEGRKRLAFQQLLGQTSEKGTVQESTHFVLINVTI